MLIEIRFYGNIFFIIKGNKKSLERDRCHDEKSRSIIYNHIAAGNSEWNKNSGSPLKVKAIRKPVNDSTMTHFERVLVDGKEVSKADYDLSEGSVIAGLKPSFLKNLAEGKHTLTLEFDDGSIDTTFTVTAAKERTVTRDYRLPLTGIE